MVQKVTDSYYIDPNSSNYIDVTNDVLPYIYDNGDNTITFNFGDINETYIITVDGQYDDSGENVKTRVTETNSDIYGGSKKSYYWDNENIIRTGDGGADGDNRQKYKLGNYVWHDIDRDGVQGTDENEKPISNVEVILRDENGKEIGRTKQMKQVITNLMD